MKHLNWLCLLLCFQLGCKSKAEKLQYLICKNSIQYWNYEWPRKNAKRHGFTFSFNKNGECLKYSYSKVKNKRSLFPDDAFSGKENWYVINDSLMYFYGGYEKVISYSEDTFFLVSLCDVNDKTMLIRVKEELNIIENDTPVSLKISDFPVINYDIGSFPYIKPLSGLKFTDTLFNSNQNKYFYFARDTIHDITGNYFHARIESLDGNLNVEDVYEQYHKKIEQDGGVLISVGSTIPDFAQEAIKKEKPSFIKDLYNYKSEFVQYVIRISDKENVWIEFLYNRKEKIIDLTVVKEKKRTIFRSPASSKDRQSLTF